MEAYFVYSEDLIKVYGQKLPLFADGQLQPNAYVDLTTIQKQQVQLITKQGPYTVVKTLHKNGNYSKFIIENSLIKQEEIVPFYEQVKPLLEKRYPGRYFIDKEYTNSMYLYYPELTITNETNNNHTIYDLVVRLYFDNMNTGQLSPQLLGTRFSFTPDELSIGYVHSHLPKHSWGEFQNFCLGSNSPFDKFIQSYNKLNTVEEFDIFLLQLKEYLEWESLKGGPHISLTNLKGGSTSGNNSNSRYALPIIVNTIRIGIKARTVLEKLIADEKYHCLLVKVGNDVVFDITKNAQVGYDFDVNVLATVFSDYTVKYNETLGEYIGNTTSPSTFNLPNISSNMTMLERHFGINRRIVIPDEDNTEHKIVNRLGANNFAQVTGWVNALLTHAHII